MTTKSIACCRRAASNCLGTIDLLNTCYMLMFDAMGGHGGEVNQMIGDGLMALFGAPLPLDDCAGSAVAAGLEMLELIEQFNQERSAVNKPAIRIGIGVASGDVVAGYPGTPAACHVYLYWGHSEPSGTAGGAHQSGWVRHSLLMTLHSVPSAAVCRCSRWARCRSRARPLPLKFSR